MCQVGRIPIIIANCNLLPLFNVRKSILEFIKKVKRIKETMVIPLV